MPKREDSSKLIMSRAINDIARGNGYVVNGSQSIYMRMSKRNSWSYRVLLNQIDNQNYEKTMVSQTNFDNNLPEKMRPEAKLAVKDEYAFDFLELGEEHSEYELERAIVRNIEYFLLATYRRCIIF